MYDYIDKVIDEKYAALTPEQKALVRFYIDGLEISGQLSNPACLTKIDMLFGLEAPNPKRTPRVIAGALISMIVVLTTALISSASNHPEMLLAIPIYGLYLMAIMSMRQRRLNMLVS